MHDKGVCRLRKTKRHIYQEATEWDESMSDGDHDNQHSRDAPDLDWGYLENGQSAAPGHSFFRPPTTVPFYEIINQTGLLQYYFPQSPQRLLHPSQSPKIQSPSQVWKVTNQSMTKMPNLCMWSHRMWRRTWKKSLSLMCREMSPRVLWFPRHAALSKNRLPSCRGWLMPVERFHDWPFCKLGFLSLCLIMFQSEMDPTSNEG